MKTPRQCYRLGTEFKVEFPGGFKEIWIFKRLGMFENGKLKFDFLVKHTEKEISSMHTKMFDEMALEILSITAETLAELAIKRGEEVVIEFHPKYIDLTVYTFDKNEKIKKSYSFSLKKEEPTGEFFLRVAKKRKYIK